MREKRYLMMQSNAKLCRQCRSCTDKNEYVSTGDKMPTRYHRSIRRHTYPSATLSMNFPIWTGLESNPGLHSDRLMTSSQNQGMVTK